MKKWEIPLAITMHVFAESRQQAIEIVKKEQEEMGTVYCRIKNIYLIQRISNISNEPLVYSIGE